MISDHSCYILRSKVYNKTYIGYTINFNRRLRQHNGEIVGGAKRTKNSRPWEPICRIEGFVDQSSALRFEYRLQHPRKRKKRNDDSTLFVLNNLCQVIDSGDGSKILNNVIPWPILTITWFYPHHRIDHWCVINNYS